MKLFFTGFLLILFSLSCSKKRESVYPSIENISESVYASGIIKSKNQYQVYSTVNGLIIDKYVTEGDLVKKGDPLFRVLNETSRLNAENAKLSAVYSDLKSNEDKLNQLKINIDFARSKMQNDSLLLQRQRNLWANQIGSQNELEQRELAYKSALTAFESASLNYNDVKKQLTLLSQQSKNNLAISKSVLNDFTIKSETDGRVYNILKEKGELVVSQSPIAVIGDSASFILELQVDEYDISRIIPGLKCLLSLDSYKGQVFEASITKINPIMNERSRSFTVDAAFITRPPVLYPNLTVEANIIIKTKEKALTIPRSFLFEDTYVLKENNDKVLVKVGLKDYQKAEILSGINKEDKIIKPAK